MFSASVSPVADNQENVSLAAMFRIFPVAAADRFNVDEQAFIFVPKFRVQVARLASADQRQRNPPRACQFGGSRCRQPPTAVARKQKVSQSFQTDLPRPVLREKRIPFARNPNQSYKSRHPGPQEGRIAIVTNVGPGCGGRDSARRVMGRAGRVFP
jgi:hypothetical protein